MSFAVITITVVIVVLLFFPPLWSMKPFRFLQYAGSNRVELSLVTTTTSSYVDIISHLPDDLLLRILSFNKTKDVMATSLLSKRWRSLWTLVPGLGFDDSNHNVDYERFKQFVHKSFLSNKAPGLEHLHLRLLSLGSLGFPMVDTRQWINLAVRRHVRELHIEISPFKQVSVAFPSSLYTSETLQRLKLINCHILEDPVHVLLPSLKTLFLKFVTYSHKTSQERLLSGCPNIEVLSVEHDLIDFNIVLPSLQRLHMFQQGFGSRRLGVIDVPSLKYLKIRDTVSCNVRRIENMPELVRAHVGLRGGVSTHNKFLEALTSVHHLTLSISVPLVITNI